MISGQCRILEPYLGFSSLLVLSRQPPLYVRNKITNIQTNSKQQPRRVEGERESKKKDVTRVEKPVTSETNSPQLLTIYLSSSPYISPWGGKKLVHYTVICLCSLFIQKELTLVQFDSNKIDTGYLQI